MNHPRKLVTVAVSALLVALAWAAPAPAMAASAPTHVAVGHRYQVPDRLRVRVDGRLYTSLHALRSVKGHVAYLDATTSVVGSTSALYTSLARVPGGVSTANLWHLSLPVTPYRFELLTGEWRHTWTTGVGGGYQTFQTGAGAAMEQAWSEPAELGRPFAAQDSVYADATPRDRGRYLDGYYAALRLLGQHGVYPA